VLSRIRVLVRRECRVGGGGGELEVVVVVVLVVAIFCSDNG
jgi:hypothetical protein